MDLSPMKSIECTKVLEKEKRDFVIVQVNQNAIVKIHDDWTTREIH